MSDHPHTLLNETSLESGELATFAWTHDASYEAPPRQRELAGALQRIDGEDICVITDSIGAFNKALGNEALGNEALGKKAPGKEASGTVNIHDIAAAVGAQAINLSAPLPLTPVEIPKPWGKEIWHTGIEARGVSTTGTTPIPWVLDAFGPLLYGPAPPPAPVLLKVLAPRPQENLGDLYFELHREKIEVYVVTRIDPEAWPGGTGAIRYGFSQEARGRFESDGAFVSAYRESVNAYRAIREEMDGKYGGKTDTMPAALVAAEAARRKEMYAFTSLRPLNVGDIVTVTPRTPHSLQHGVRVVEFQTPHYERFILSFGQKALTQGHWDTEAALDIALLDAPATPPPEKVSEGVEMVADFDELTALRITLDEGQTIQLERGGYLVAMGISGSASVGRGNGRAATVSAEQAIFVAAGRDGVAFSAAGDGPATLLAAYAPSGSKP